MTEGLRRFHHSAQSHFVTMSCYHRRPRFNTPSTCDLFLHCLEEMRRRFSMRIYGYVVMPEHVHLLVSEPGPTVPQVRVRSLDANLGSDTNPNLATLADALHFLKLSFTKRLPGLIGETGPFWQKRYYDRNVRDEDEFKVKLRYVHRNRVKRGLVTNPADWTWSSFRNYALREVGMVEIESPWTASDRETKSSGGRPRLFLSPG
jgi:putative transposase